MGGSGDTWQRLFALAEQPRGDGDSRLSLASAEAGEERSGGDLKHSKGPWGEAAAVTGDVQASMRSAKTKLESSHAGVGSEGAGLTSVRELGPVRESWERRLQDAVKECGSLETALNRVAREHAENEERTEASFDGADVRGDARAEGGGNSGG